MFSAPQPHDAYNSARVRICGPFYLHYSSVGKACLFPRRISKMKILTAKKVNCGNTCVRGSFYDCTYAVCLDTKPAYMQSCFSHSIDRPSP